MATNSSTNYEVKEATTCTWTIDEFNNVNDYVHSSAFYVPSGKDQFYLYLHQDRQLFGENLVYICMFYNRKQTELFLQYRVSILDANGHKKYTKEYTWNYSKCDYDYSYYNAASFISRNKCNELLVNGSLKIYCEVIVLKNKPQPAINMAVKETAKLSWCNVGYIRILNQFNSPKFSTPIGNDQFDLSLILDNRLFRLGHAFICLHYKGNQTELALQYRVSILDANGHKKYTREYTWNYSKSDYVNCEYNATNYISREECKKLLVIESLKIYCEVDVLEYKVLPRDKTKIETQDTAKDYLSILENGEFSDFVFIVRGKEFKVHKNILSARSPVFKTMFKTDFEENRLNRSEITDIDVEVFGELLRYIYTGSILDLDKYDSELFMASDKYQLDHLKSICEQSFCASLNAESVAATFQLADLHQAEHLRSKCVEFITANAADVVATDGWKQLRKNRPELVAELLENMIIIGKK